MLTGIAAVMAAVFGYLSNRRSKSTEKVSQATEAAVRNGVSDRLDELATGQALLVDAYGTVHQVVVRLESDVSGLDARTRKVELQALDNEMKLIELKGAEHG